jgi:hypothetical protein
MTSRNRATRCAEVDRYVRRAGDGSGCVGRNPIAAFAHELKSASIRPDIEHSPNEQKTGFRSSYEQVGGDLTG